MFGNLIANPDFGHRKVDFDVANQTYMYALEDAVLRPKIENGLDFWWIDWQQGEDTKVLNANPTYILNRVRHEDNCRWDKDDRSMVAQKFRKSLFRALLQGEKHTTNNFAFLKNNFVYFIATIT